MNTTIRAADTPHGGRSGPVRLRRPSGEPPPIRREARWAWWGFALLGVVATGLALHLLERHTTAFDSIDDVSRRWFDTVRSDQLDRAARGVDTFAGLGVVLAVRWIAVIVLLVQRRTRHAVVFVATFVVTDWVVARVLSFPSGTVSAFAVTCFAAALAFTPSGRQRRRALVAIVVLLAAVVLARVYLGVDEIVGMLYSAVLAGCVCAFTFGWLAPESSFPIVDRRRTVTAHLALDEERTTAIVNAVRSQLALDVTAIEPFGRNGSSGSAPIRITTSCGTRLFGKVYSSTHERSDRWYRLGRTLLYGELEDEVPTRSVRRLAAYEDYALRLLDDHGVPVAHSLGVVELIPNEEYLLVTELFEDASKLGELPVTDTVIDSGLGLVHRLREIGVAHRDIKPANVLVRHERLQLVDVSNLEVRPSSWRSSIDLANMMLTLALVTYPDVVYERAQRWFTPLEIAAAFAATEGLTVPTELSGRLEADGRPLLERFVQLAPPHQRVAIQRWSARRIALLGAAGLVTSTAVAMFVDAIHAGLT